MSVIKLKVGKQKDIGKKIATNYLTTEESIDKLKKIELKTKADKTKNLLEDVCSRLESLDYNNFETLFPELISNMKEAANLRDELINEVGTEKLIEKRPELFSTAKQIEIKYDSTVKKFLEESIKTEIELNSLYQQKKLTVYQR